MSQSPIFTRTESFMGWLLAHTAKFPRPERFRLAKRMDDSLFEMHSAFLHATKADDPLLHLQQADLYLLHLRTYIRLSVEMGYTTDKQFKYATEKLDEIGRLLGGWQKKVTRSERSDG
jgi:hypothetical protein